MKKLNTNIKPTFDDWWFGRTFLNTSAIEINKRADSGIKTKIEDYSFNHQKLILKKQKEFFESECKSMCASYLKEFKKRFANSEVKEMFLESELLDLEHLFNTQTMSGLKFRNRDFTISQDNLIEMRRFMETFIVRGIKDFSFVHSPNYKFPMLEYVRPFKFMYANWLYFNCLSEFKVDKDLKEKLALKNIKIHSVKNRLPIPVVALIHHYKNILITVDNADEIAKKYQYNSKRSGLGLYHDYLWFSNNKNRILFDDRYKKPVSKLKHLEKAASILKGNAKLSAIKDIEEFKKKLKNIEN
jgi:hypothetical protein